MNRPTHKMIIIIINYFLLPFFLSPFSSFISVCIILFLFPAHVGPIYCIVNVTLIMYVAADIIINQLYWRELCNLDNL